MNKADQATLDRLKANRIALGLDNVRMIGLGGDHRLTPEKRAAIEAETTELNRRLGPLVLPSFSPAQLRDARLRAERRKQVGEQDRAEAIQRRAREAQARAERPANLRLIKWAIIGALIGAVIRYLLVGRLW